MGSLEEILAGYDGLQAGQDAFYAVLEPEVGFEPTTFRLRVGCATTTPLGLAVRPNRSA
jgi:hypothetical protein